MHGASILLVGGLERLDAHYRMDAPLRRELSEDAPFRIDAAYTDSSALARRLETADAIVLVTGHISHAAAHKVRSVARRRGIPLVSALTPGLSAVRNALGAALVALSAPHEMRRTA